jgi:hypothetical protein
MLWDLERRRLVRDRTGPWCPPQQPESLYRDAGRWKAVCTYYGGKPVLFVDLATGRTERTLPDPEASHPQASPEGSWVAFRTQDRKQLVVRSLPTLVPAGTVKPIAEKVGQNWRFVSDAAVADITDRIEIWDVRSRRLRLTLVPDGPEGFGGEWIAYTPEGEFTGSKDCLRQFQPEIPSPRKTPER